MSKVPASYSIPSSPTPIHPYKLAMDILIPLGEYFQVQDDFLDYAGTPEQIGKIGTDILDNKCSWCINTALAHASPEQRRILDDNYGQKDAEKEARVKAVYEQLGLREKYAKYEEAAYTRITALIATIPEVPEGTTNNPAIKREVFTSFLEKIYRRTK
jgi:farnesyl diphosphate synthase